jgi:hypothetical protein
MAAFYSTVTVGWQEFSATGGTGATGQETGPPAEVAYSGSQTDNSVNWTYWALNTPQLSGLGACAVNTFISTAMNPMSGSGDSLSDLLKLIRGYGKGTAECELGIP